MCIENFAQSIKRSVKCKQLWWRFIMLYERSRAKLNSCVYSGVFLIKCYIPCGEIFLFQCTCESKYFIFWCWTKCLYVIWQWLLTMVTVNDYLQEEKHFKCLLDEVFKCSMALDNVSDYLLWCYVFFWGVELELCIFLLLALWVLQFGWCGTHHGLRRGNCSDFEEVLLYFMLL